ncbi:MAG: cation diffusion facilitator family transporter [Pseudomonadota bacterium]
MSSAEQLQASRAGRRVTYVGLAVNLVLTGVKFAAGYWGRSQAMIADAVHSLSDLFTDAVVLVGLKYGRQGPDETHPFGHARLETMASAVVGLALLGVAVEIAYQAGFSIRHHAGTRPTWLALVAAAVSILSKEALYQYTAAVGKKIKSPAVVANAWHHRSDAWSSVAVLLGVAAAQVDPSWYILDSYAALLVSVFIFKVGVDILWGCAKELTDSAPKPEVLHKIMCCAQSVPGVLEVHDLRVRSSGGVFQMELHVVVDGGLTVAAGHGIAKDVETCLLRDVADVGRVIVHVDPDDGRPAATSAAY